MNDSQLADASTVALSVAHSDGLVRLVFRDNGAAIAEIPIAPGAARALASELLGAAKAADPAGHQQILDGIRAVVEQHTLEQLTATPGAWN